jgi:hypothetical protein
MTQLLASITLLQAPAPEHASVVQDSPSSQEAEPQQMPSTQLPLAQAKPCPQVSPLGFFWQVVPTQLLPPESSELDGAKALQSAVELEQALLHCPVAALHW